MTQPATGPATQKFSRTYKGFIESPADVWTLMNAVNAGELDFVAPEMLQGPREASIALDEDLHGTIVVLRQPKDDNRLWIDNLRNSPKHDWTRMFEMQWSQDLFIWFTTRVGYDRKSENRVNQSTDLNPKTDAGKFLALSRQVDHREVMQQKLIKQTWTFETRDEMKWLLASYFYDLETGDLQRPSKDPELREYHHKVDKGNLSGQAAPVAPQGPSAIAGDPNHARHPNPRGPELPWPVEPRLPESRPVDPMTGSQNNPPRQPQGAAHFGPGAPPQVGPQGYFPFSAFPLHPERHLPPPASMNQYGERPLLPPANFAFGAAPGRRVQTSEHRGLPAQRPILFPGHLQQPAQAPYGHHPMQVQSAQHGFPANYHPQQQQQLLQGPQGPQGQPGPSTHTNFQGNPGQFQSANMYSPHYFQEMRR